MSTEDTKPPVTDVPGTRDEASFDHTFSYSFALASDPDAEPYSAEEHLYTDHDVNAAATMPPSPDEQTDISIQVDGSPTEPHEHADQDFKLSEEQCREIFEPADQYLDSLGVDTSIAVSPPHNFAGIDDNMQLVGPSQHSTTQSYPTEFSNHIHENENESELLHYSAATQSYPINVSHNPFEREADPELQPSPDRQGEDWPQFYNSGSHYPSVYATAAYHETDSMRPSSAGYYNGDVRPAANGLPSTTIEYQAGKYAESFSPTSVAYYYPSVNEVRPYSSPGFHHGNTVASGSEAPMFDYYSSTRSPPHGSGPNMAGVRDPVNNIDASSMAPPNYNADAPFRATGIYSKFGGLHSDSLLTQQRSQSISPTSPTNHGYENSPQMAREASPGNLISSERPPSETLVGIKLDKMQPYKGFFKNAQSAYAYMNQIRRYYEVRGEDDWSVVDADAEPYVSDIYEAMSTLSQDADRAQMSYWNTMTRKNHTQEMLEARSWIMVDTAIKQHQFGIPNFPELEINKRDEQDRTMCCSDRVRRLRDILFTDKLVCKDVVDGNKIPYLVATPNAWITRKNDNRRLNKDKGTIMRAGKQTMSKYQNAQLLCGLKSGTNYDSGQPAGEVQGLATGDGFDTPFDPALPVENKTKHRAKSSRVLARNTKKENRAIEETSRQTRSKRKAKDMEDE